MKKKKIIGYTVGSFDLFHIGHLNILKKAKEHCDYLIVEINSDKTIKKCKGKTPIIPFEERKAIIESIIYVDEAVKVEVEGKNQKGDDWGLRVNSDIVFSGDDHDKDPDWKELIEKKKENNTRVMYFPYTKTTSSTKIRKLINQQLNKSK